MSKVTKLPSNPTKPRRCLTCGSDFPSEGPHNRICRKCKSSKLWRDGEVRTVGVRG